MINFYDPWEGEVEKQQKKPNWFKRHKIFTTIICTVLVMAFFASFAKDDKTVNNSKEPEKAQAATPKAPEKPKTWQKVAELSGSTEKKSPVFTLDGNETKMTYSATGRDMGILSIYLVKEGHDLQSEGGFPEVSISKPTTDETRITKPAGNYFLDVSSTFDYTITIEELR